MAAKIPKNTISRKKKRPGFEPGQFEKGEGKAFA